MSKVLPLTFGISKMYLVQGEGKILVDTGCIESKETYEAAFADLGVNPNEVRLIVITHGHWDHYARANELKEITGANILCHKNALQSIQAGTNSPMFPRGEIGKAFIELIGDDVNIKCEPVTPDIVVDATYDLAPFGVAGKVVHTPGHSDCSVSVLLDSGKQ